MRLKLFIGFTLISCSLSVTANLETEPEILSYSLGARLAEKIKLFDNINQEALYQGIRDVLEERELQITSEEIQKNIAIANSLQQKKHQFIRNQAISEGLLKSEAFLIENNKKPGIVSLKSGLQYRVLKEGTGPKPTLSDTVIVHYEGRLLDGSLFDSSHSRQKPARFQLNRLIPGWAEGLQEMPEGSVWEFYIPPSLAYGEYGVPGKIGPNEALFFKVELQSVIK